MRLYIRVNVPWSVWIKYTEIAQFEKEIWQICTLFKGQTTLILYWLKTMGHSNGLEEHEYVYHFNDGSLDFAFNETFTHFDFW